MPLSTVFLRPLFFSRLKPYYWITITAIKVSPKFCSIFKIVFLERRKGHFGGRQGRMVNLGSKTLNNQNDYKIREKATRPGRSARVAKKALETREDVQKDKDVHGKEWSKKESHPPPALKLKKMTIAQGKNTKRANGSISCSPTTFSVKWRAPKLILAGI